MDIYIEDHAFYDDDEENILTCSFCGKEVDELNDDEECHECERTSAEEYALISDYHASIL